MREGRAVALDCSFLSAPLPPPAGALGPAGGGAARHAGPDRQPGLRPVSAANMPRSPWGPGGRVGSTAINAARRALYLRSRVLICGQ